MGVLQKIWEGGEQPGKAAYDLTLSKHHNWAQRKLTSFFIGQIPGRKQEVYGHTALLLSQTDAQHSQVLIDREVARAVQTFAPALQEAMAISTAAAVGRA